jgi:hypothetical protein
MRCKGICDLMPFLGPVNYARRIKVPVLMVDHICDEVFPVATAQPQLFSLLGSSSGSERPVLREPGHGPPPRADVLRERRGWCDKYLGRGPATTGVI